MTKTDRVFVIGFGECRRGLGILGAVGTFWAFWGCGGYVIKFSGLIFTKCKVKERKIKNSVANFFWLY